MLHRSTSLFRLSALILAGACAAPGDEAPSSASASSASSSSGASAAMLAERAKISASGKYLAPPGKGSPGVLGTTEAEILAALDIPPEFNPRVVTLTRSHDDAAFDMRAWGAIQPTRGNSFAVLSTGRSNAPTPYAEPGTDLGAAGTAGDSTFLRLQMDIPAGVNRMTFDYNFLSTEWPEYVQSSFNDSFSVVITDRNGTRPAIPAVNVDNSAFQPAADTLIGDNEALQFRIYVDDTFGIDTVNLTGANVDAGITGYQRVDIPIADDGTLTLDFEIHDVGDGLLDSAVVLDNISFATVELVDPSPLDAQIPAQNLIDSATSRVTTDTARLLAGGRPVRAVAADGTAQILLRSVLPGPGRARFAVETSGADAGSVSAHDQAELAWMSSVEVESIAQNGKNYAFALYRAPANFIRDGQPGDAALAKRTVALSMTYVPTGLQRTAEIEVVRRPVVVVHDLWSDCTAWKRAQIWQASENPEATNFLNLKCIDYNPAKGLAFNAGVVRTAIDDVYINQRESSVAVTQVDLIGHGVGGILARQYLQADGYKSAKTFGAGDVNRFIAMNVPHRGSRMACELTDFRDYAKSRGTWVVPGNPGTSVKNKLEAARIFIDNATGDRILDDIQRKSADIDGLAAITVPTHVLTGTGALAFPQNSGSNTPLLTDIKYNVSLLYSNLQGGSRRTVPLPPAERQKSLYGNQSLFFCDDGNCNPAVDDHDLFLSIVEQKGGLDGARVSHVPVALDQLNSAHWHVNFNGPQSDELTRLVGARLDGGDFTTAMDPLPAVTSPACPPMPAALAQAMRGPSIMASPVSEDLRIAGPPPGTTVTPGAILPLTVTGINGFVPEEVLIFSGGITADLIEPPFTYDFEVPREAGGAITIEAMAFGAGGTIAFAPSLTLNVAIAATLTRLQLLGGDILLLRPGASRQLTVLGTYSDGVVRDLTETSKGTRYTISNAGTLPLVNVSATGLATARFPGDATITASNGNKLTSISVKIGAAFCGDGILDPGEECDDGNREDGDSCSATCRITNHAPVAVCQSPTVCTDAGVCHAQLTGLGAGSTDPDGDLLSFSQLPAGPYGVGQQSVAVEVSDGELVSTCQAAVTVDDCELPALSCPADFRVECSGNGQGNVVAPAATASDNCGVTVHAPTGGALALGSHQLSYEAVDPSGNSRACATEVIVEDTVPPSLTCPAPRVAECTGNGHATVDLGRATATDSCAPPSVTAPGPQSYPLGVTQVLYTATDAGGHQATCTSRVTVRDTRAPTATSTGAPPLWPPTHEYVTVSLADCGIQVTDRCEGALPPSIHQAQVNCVTSDEEDDAPGDSDGHTTNDIVVVDSQTVRLRAEQDDNGDGRLYNIYFKIVDSAGNARNGVCPVEVRAANCQPGHESDPQCPPDDSGGKHSVCF